MVFSTGSGGSGASSPRSSGSASSASVPFPLPGSHQVTPPRPQQQQEPEVPSPLKRFQRSAKQAVHLAGLEQGTGSLDSVVGRRSNSNHGSVQGGINNKGGSQHSRSSSSASAQRRRRRPSRITGEADTIKDKLKAAKEVAYRPQFGPAKAGLGSKHSKPLRIKKRVEDQHWIEVLDTKHRYGSNLKHYHAVWLRCESTQSFFTWLDEGEGKDLSLSVCSREKLENERIIYLTSSQRSRYLMSIDNEGKFRWDDPEPRYAEIEKHPLVDSTPGAFVDTMGDGILPRYLAGEQETEDHARTKTDDRVPEPKAEAARIGNQVNGQPNGQEQGPKMRKYKSLGEPKEAKDIFIYVSDLHYNMYCCIKHKGRFQHSSLLSGGPITSAGILQVTNGMVTKFSPMSGHYRTTSGSFDHFIKELKARGADLSRIDVVKTKAVLWFIQKANTYHGIKKKMRHQRKDLVYGAKEKLEAL